MPNAHPCFRNVIGIDWVCILETSFNNFVSAMNRSITVAIALYRYALIFYPYFFIDKTNKLCLHLAMVLLILGKILPFSILFISLTIESSDPSQ